MSIFKKTVRESVEPFKVAFIGFFFQFLQHSLLLSFPAGFRNLYGSISLLFPKTDS